MAQNDVSANAANQSDNLDLTNVKSSDHQTLASSIETFYKQDGIMKTQLAWHWERVHLMLDGKQWIVYEGNRQTGGMWKPLRVSRANEWIPRPVTNYMYDAYQTLKAYVLKNKPRSTVRPNTNTHQDKSAAKLANLVVECNYERMKEQYNYEYAAANLVTYGTVFKKDYWDRSSIAKSQVPMMEVVMEQDPMTGEVTEKEMPVLDPETGEPVYETLDIGDLNTYIVEPYRMVIDPIAPDLHNARWVMEYSIQPLDWIRETYSAKEGEELPEGYTGKAKDVKPEPNLSNSMRRWFELKTSAGTKGSDTAFSGSTGSDIMIQNAAIVKEYYEKPSEQHENGRLIVVANGVCLYAGESPYQGPELGDWHPYSECRWELVPGRFWGKGPLDDAAEIQKIINSIDAVIILSRKTTAIPQKLIPIGIGIEPGKWTGRPGQEIFYRPDPSGNLPQTIPPVGVDESVFAERERRLEDFKQVTGAIDILKGDRPPGVTAASALNMLYEVGTGKLFPILDRWKAFVESSQKKQLRLVANKYREPREDFIRLLKAKNQDLAKEEIERFLGTSLHDNCNVVIEAGSNIPKLQAAKQAMLLELAQTGSLNLENPTNRRKFNEDMGVLGYDNEVAPDIKRAEYENDIMDGVVANPENRPVVLEVDNHQLHLEIHATRMKEPSFMAQPPEVMQAYMNHMEEHREWMAQAQQQLMMESMMMGTPPAPEANPADPTPIQGAGGGISTNLQEEVLKDVNTPGGIE